VIKRFKFLVNYKCWISWKFKVLFLKTYITWFHLNYFLEKLFRDEDFVMIFHTSIWLV